jgi:hypothetical protein
MIEAKTISFNKSGYDPFIDFIKAYAIICVLIGHTLPSHDYWGYGLWAGMQVPLFVLVQAFHCFKKDTSNINLKKIFSRVVLPYILVQSIAFLYILYIDSTKLYSFLLSGGAGPGSYYPWVFVQIAVLLPIIKKWLDNNQKDKTKVLITFLVICEFFEILFSIIDLPDRLYRLLAIRYLFLFYLAWVWVRDGICINKKTTLLSILSLIAIIYFEYFSVDDEVIFYNTAWKFHRWPCYYFVSVWGVYLLRMLYRLLCDRASIMKSIKLLAKCSYEIFLIQMIVLYNYPSWYTKDLIIMSGINNHLLVDLLQLIIRIMVVFFFSIFIGYYFNIYYNKLISKYN